MSASTLKIATIEERPKTDRYQRIATVPTPEAFERLDAVIRELHSHAVDMPTDPSKMTRWMIRHTEMIQDAYALSMEGRFAYASAARLAGLA